MSGISSTRRTTAIAVKSLACRHSEIVPLVVV